MLQAAFVFLLGLLHCVEALLSLDETHEDDFFLDLRVNLYYEVNFLKVSIFIYSE